MSGVKGDIHARTLGSVILDKAFIRVMYARRELIISLVLKLQAVRHQKRAGLAVEVAEGTAQYRRQYPREIPLLARAHRVQRHLPNRVNTITIIFTNSNNTAVISSSNRVPSHRRSPNLRLPRRRIAEPPLKCAKRRRKIKVMYWMI